MTVQVIAERHQRLEDVSSHKELCHSLCRNHRGGCLFDSRPRHSTIGNPLRADAEALVGEALDAGGLVRRSALRPCPRVGQLAHLQPALRQRISIHARNLDERGRAAVYVGDRLTARATVPRLPRLAQGRGLMGGMAEHVAGVRVALAGPWS